MNVNSATWILHLNRKIISRSKRFVEELAMSRNERHVLLFKGRSVASPTEKAQAEPSLYRALQQR